MTSAEVTEKILRILADTEGVNDFYLESLANEYASHCRRLDANMERATNLIKSGSFCEADRIIRERSIFEECATLSFRERDEWLAVCRAFNLPTCPGVSESQLATLRQFYETYDRSRALFSKHRRLALELGATKERLETLYQLESLFPNSSVWTRTIEALERKRVDEIVEEFRIEGKEGTRSSFFLEAYAELTDPRRHTPVPSDLIESLRQWGDYSSNLSTLESFRRELAAWEEAAAQEDESGMLQRLAQFRTFDLSRASYATREELARFETLRRRALQIERREASRVELKRKIKQLSRAVETSNDVDALSNLLSAVELTAENAEVAAPNDVVRACERRIESLTLQRSRRKNALSLATIGIVLLFAFAVFVAIAQTKLSRDAKNAAEELNRKLDLFEGTETNEGFYEALADATKLVEHTKKKFPKLLGTATYGAALDRYAQVSHDEKKRAEAFDDVAFDVEQAHESGFAAPASVNQLDKLKRTDAEKETFRNLKKEDLDLKRESDDEKQDRYDVKLSQLVDDERALEGAPIEKVDETNGAILRIRHGIGELDAMERYGSFPEQSIEAKKTLIAALDSFERRFNETKKSLAIAEKLRGAVGQVDAYQNALQEVKTTIQADDANAAALDRASKDAEAATNVKTWDQFVVSHGNVAEWSKDAASFKSVALVFDANGKALATAPEFEETRAQFESLRKFGEAGGRANASNAMRLALKKYAKPTWVYFKSDDENYYYLTSKPSSPGAQGVERLTSAEGDVKEFPTSNLTQSDVAAIVESTQYAITKDALERLDADADAWFDVLCAILRGLDDAPKERFDPIVKTVLLYDVLKSAEGFPFFSSFDAWLVEVDASEDFDRDVDFYNSSEATRELRAAAQALLKSAPDILKAVETARAEYSAASKKSVPSYEWVGFVDVKDEQPRLTTSDAATLQEGSTLWIKGDADVLVKCGSVVAGVGKLNVSDDLAQRRWTPVYMRVESK